MKIQSETKTEKTTFYEYVKFSKLFPLVLFDSDLIKNMTSDTMLISRSCLLKHKTKIKQVQVKFSFHNGIAQRTTK